MTSTMYIYTYFLTTIFCAVCATVILRHASFDMGSERQIKFFRNFISFYLLFVVTNGFCLWFNYKRLVVPGYIFSTLNLLSLFFCAFFWYFYAEQKLGSRLNASRSETIIFMIPAIFIIGLVVTSPFTHLVFYYNEEGVYQQGDLYFVMLAAGFFYLALAAGRAYADLKNAKTASQRKEHLYLMFFLIFPVIAGVIDLFIPHLPVMEWSVLLAIILVYLTLQQSQIYTDALTGLYNRRATDELLAEKLPSVNENDPLHVLVADIDGFKKVNDEYGHNEGDRALRAIASEIKAFADANHLHAARWGGDEFLLLADRKSALEPEAVVQAITARIEALNDRGDFPFRLRLSIGHSTLADPAKHIEAAIYEADQSMYAQKNRK